MQLCWGLRRGKLLLGFEACVLEREKRNAQRERCRGGTEGFQEEMGKKSHDQSARRRLRKCEQNPVAGCFPFSFEAGIVFFQKLSLRGVVEQDHVLRGHEAGDDYEVERQAAAGLEGCDQRASCGEVLLQVGPLAGEGEGAETILREIALHVSGVDAMGLVGVQGVKDLGDVGGG